MNGPGRALVPDADAVIDVLRTEGSSFAFVHGSRVAGTARPDSDIDVAAWFGGADPAPWDVLLPGNTDLLVLDCAPLELAGRVALHGVLLFDADPPARVAWQADTRLVYLDELPFGRELAATFFEGSVVDELRVERLLGRVLADVVTLRSLHPHSQPVDSVRLAAIKYGFVTAIEGCTRVAQHIGASEGWRAPDSNADALAVLAEHGVIEVERGIDLARAVGSRNLLVHQYADVDAERVVSMLERVGDLEDFVGAVSAWIAAQH